MKKSIQINGKRNIDGLKNINAKKKCERKQIINIKDTDIENSLNSKSQIELLNKLYLEEDYSGVSFMKKELREK